MREARGQGKLSSLQFATCPLQSYMTFGGLIMNRTKGVLVAGTLTGLVLVTLLAFGFGNLGCGG